MGNLNECYTPGYGFPSIGSAIQGNGGNHNAFKVNIANADDSPILSEVDS